MTSFKMTSFELVKAGFWLCIGFYIGTTIVNMASAVLVYLISILTGALV